VDLSGLTTGSYDFTYSHAAAAGCPATSATVTITITPAPVVDNPADIEICDSYVLPSLTNGNYFDAPNGGGNALFAGDIITTTSTVYVFNPSAGICPDAENSFTVTINTVSLSLNVSNESCWESGDGFIDVNIASGLAPYIVQLNSEPSETFPNNNFVINGLTPGNYTLNVTDGNGCQTSTTFDILPGGPNLDALVEPVYSCESGTLINSIVVDLVDPSIGQDILYALDSTNPDDFVITPSFENLSPGNHVLSILHTNGCLSEIPFTIESIEELGLSLSNSSVNEITANVTGGAAPYIYFFDDNPASDTNTFSIDRNGTFVVRVVDANGCEISERITLNFEDLSIPNFFTPNNDGQNDFWAPRNIELFPDIQTYIFDRYGRKIKIMGGSNRGWDGYYESKPLPSGDYWYIIKLNDGSGREYVGHFTLYR
ncbi:T9SS type B sorting domain-containing protein, partial [Flagellimonas amphidinii]